MKSRPLPEATVSRLPLYLTVLIDSTEQKDGVISSERMAELTGVNAAKVRKDLSQLGAFGTRGVGYDIRALVERIHQEMGLTLKWRVAIVGFGNLGHALANYAGFEDRGFQIVAAFDNDRSKVGDSVGDFKVAPIEDLAEIVRKRKVNIAIVATPAAAAQDVVNELVEAGVDSILNFAPVVTTVPDGISLRRVDLSTELQILSYYHHRGRGAAKKVKR